MATILSFLSGRQITNSNGVPQAGALLYHYQASTTNNLTVYSNQAGTTPHAQPVVCDSGGFVPLIYVGESSDWKIVVQTSAAVTLQTYDNLPKAVAATTSASFAPSLWAWSQVTSASSPVSLLAANAGNAYEADTTSGSITFNLPSAASVGNGKGFLFKKTNSANSVIIDASGSETIDGALTFTITQVYQTIAIFSNGATWYREADIPGVLPTVQIFSSGSGTYTPATGTRYIIVSMSGGGGGGNSGNNSVAATAGGDTTFGSWTAIKGAAGSQNTSVAGGTGGATGTGTLINRISGGSGQVNSGSFGGNGGASAFGGNGKGSLLSGVAGTAATGPGSGGGGGFGTAGGAGGSAAEYVKFFVSAPTATSYAVGAAGAAGTGTSNGGAAAAGKIIIEEYYV